MKGPIYRTPREKFLRDAEREADQQDQHRVRVRFDGRYRAVCSCCWISPTFGDREAAEVAGFMHRGDVV